MARSPSSLVQTAMHIRQNAPNTSVGSHNRRRKRMVMRPIKLTQLPFHPPNASRQVGTESARGFREIYQSDGRRTTTTSVGSIRNSNRPDHLATGTRKDEEIGDLQNAWPVAIAPRRAF